MGSAVLKQSSASPAELRAASSHGASCTWASAGRAHRLLLRFRTDDCRRRRLSLAMGGTGSFGPPFTSELALLFEKTGTENTG